ncbi:MAG: hypothetical protein K6C13_12035 [Oscillospiraceae bacterium]|nr:hypothetical protein [Oscillospiraceae bacterium]
MEGEIVLKTMKSLFLSAAVMLTVCAAVPWAAVSVSADEAVTYLDADGTEMTCTYYTTVTSDETNWTGDWFFVNKDTEITDRIWVTGDVKLILADGVTLTAPYGISVNGSDSITIYAQSTAENTMGTLYAVSDSLSAAIGSDESNDCGTITINGGTVTAAGGYGAAAIGGGINGDGGTITINGGTVTAAGGYGAAIGGGWKGDGGTITINGGTVTAAGEDGATIGGGCEGDGGTITINGGTVNATGDSGGAAIGGGCEGDGGTITISGGTVTAEGYGAAAIGGGINGDGGTITINGGTVNANSNSGGAAIGGGGDNGDGGNITISGGTVTAAGGFFSVGIGGGYNAAGGNITISGGRVTASSIDIAAVGAGNDTAPDKLAATVITLGWTNADDFINVDGAYSGKVTLAKPFVIDGTTDAAYRNSASDNNIDGKKLVPASSEDCSFPPSQIIPPVTKYTVTAPAGITVSTASAQAGDTITVTMNDQTIAVNADGREIARISGYNGTFTMPASDVTLSVIPASNMFAGKSPNSYVYVCDADMKPVMMRASNTGSITIRLGSGNAEKTVILYAEKNSTKTKLAEAETDEDGNVTLDIGCGKNYTLVIE